MANAHILNGALLAVLASPLGCGGQRETHTATQHSKELHAGGVPIEAPPSQLIADSTYLRAPLQVRTWRGLIAVSDGATDSLMVVFDAGTQRYLGQVGTRKVGDRYVYPMMLEPPLDSTDGFRIFDPISSVVVTIGIGKAGRFTKVRQLPTQNSILQPLYLKNGEFYSTGLRINGRFNLFTSDGYAVATKGSEPPGPSTIPVFVRQHANSARGVLNAKFDRVAFAGRYSDKLEVYDTSGRVLAAGSRPLHFDPSYSVGMREGAPALSMNANSRIGYVDISADSSHIYGLFAGRAISGYGSAAYDATEVHVYGWGGKLQRIIRLGLAASEFTVSQDGRFLYALTRRPRPALFRYALARDVDSGRVQVGGKLGKDLDP